MRAAVQGLAVPHATSSHLSVSVDVVSTRPYDKLRSSDLIEAADASLYVAKRSGRNAVAEHDLERTTDGGGPTARRANLSGPVAEGATVASTERPVDPKAAFVA